MPEQQPQERRPLSKNNPYALLPTSQLAAEAKRMADELLEVRPRTAEQRLAMADRCAHLLRTCSESLDKLRWATRGTH
jgi:hypothetical protein